MNWYASVAQDFHQNMATYSIPAFTCRWSVLLLLHRALRRRHSPLYHHIPSSRLIGNLGGLARQLDAEIAGRGGVVMEGEHSGALGCGVEYAEDSQKALENFSAGMDIVGSLLV